MSQLPPSLLLPLALTVGLLPFLNLTKDSEVTPEPSQAESPYSFCFAPGTDPELIARYSTPLKTKEASALSLLAPESQQAFQVVNRWFRTATNGTAQSSQGDPLTLTWSIPDDGGTFITADGSIPSEVSSNNELRSRLAEIYGGSSTGPASEQPWFPDIESAFQDLSANTGLAFVYEPNDDGAALSSANRGILGVRGDIRIAGHPLDGNSNVLAYNFFPDLGDMVIDTSDSFFSNTSSNSIRLRNVLEHEVGHGLGLAHVCPIDNSKLMEPFINLSFEGLQFDDIYSLQRNYGDIMEKHDASLTNDSFANAAPLTISSGGTATFGPLSIDDNSDIDFYAFQVTAGESITATITPTSNTYLEGSQNNDGSCSVGVLFDSATLHDLSLTLFDPNQNQLATASSKSLGEEETINPIIAPTTGTYYLQVSGDNSNNAQLYSLDLSLSNSPVVFELVSATQTAELFAGQNGLTDPLETVEYTFTLRNSGFASATNTTVTLNGPTGFIPVENTSSTATLASEQSFPFPLTFALDANSGESLVLSLNVTEDNGATATFPVEIVLGLEQVVFSENFDSSFALPIGWLSQSEGNGSGWSANAFADTEPRAFVAGTSNQSGESILSTPSIDGLSAASILSFRHFYITENNIDGSVLEISIANGPWLDILAAGGSFQTGEYNGALAISDGTNPINNRSAWTGNSGGFITTEVILPPSVAGQPTQLRWRIGHNNSGNGIGWLVDTVSIDAIITDPAEIPFNLSSNDTTASEFFLADSAELTVQTSLPVAVDSPINLTLSGTATSGTDYTQLDNLTLPAKTETLTTTINALEDSLPEGQETFTVTSSDGTTSLDYIINDSPYGNWVFESLATTTLQAPADDPDGDQLSNLEEYLLGTNPLITSLSPPFDLTFINDTLRLTLPVAAPPADLLITPFSSPNLIDWNASTFITVEGNQFILDTPAPFHFLRLGLDLRQDDTP